MPDASIVIKATDRFSDAMKTMSDSVDKFKTNLDGMQSKLNALNRTKSTLKVDTDKARVELRSAEKQFAETGDAIAEMVLQEKQLTFENARRNLSMVSKEAANVEKQMLKTGNAFSKTGNSARNGWGMGIDDITEIAKGFATGQIGQMAASSLSGLVGWSMTSAIGEPTANLISEAVGGAITGATAGAIAGIPGMVVGGVIGTAAGAISGSTKIAEAKDDAFKSYVEDIYGTVTEEQSNSLSSGSSLAAQRETDRISFATLFGEEGIADTYLANLVEMANNTPFLYDDLTGMSKTLATYGYDPDSILPVLQTIGDAGAALGQTTSDMEAMATAIGRMKSSNKTSLEYLNALNDRGVGAVGMLADAYGVDQGAIYDMISKGEIEGTKAAEIILQAMTDSFAGSMENQAKTFSGLTSTVEGLTQELDNAMGEGYNEGRMAGLAAQRDWLSGESGEAVAEANRAIGAWQAELENSKEQYIRKAMDDMMESDAYQTAKAEGDAVEMGKLIMQAKVHGMNEYNASDGAQLALEAEKSLIASIRNDTELNQDYWDAGYELGQELTKGIVAARQANAAAGLDTDSIFTSFGARAQAMQNAGLYATGIDYVPYDNFPALLHQGERVLTAEEARSGGGSDGVQIIMNGVTIREDADIDRVAAALLQKMELAGMRG